MDCTCKIGEYCERRKLKVGAALITLCREGKLDPKPEQPNVVRHVKRCDNRVQFGDLYAEELEKQFKASWLSHLPGIRRGCRACKDLQQQMNREGVAKCIARKQQIVNATAINASHVNAFVPSAIAHLYTGSDSCRAKISAAFDAAVERSGYQPKPAITKSRGFASAFRRHGIPQFITSAQLQEDTKQLISLIPADVTAICGVARSGLSVATMVSMSLHLPLIAIRQNLHDVIDVGNGWRLGGTKHIEPKKYKVCVIDDTCMTGNSLRAIEPLLKKHFDNYLTATVYTNPLALRKPDITAVELGWPHLLEWNLFNSVLSPNAACDFDGILCHDCPPGSDDDGRKYTEWMQSVKPLYLPRKTAVPLIVTARIEKYRGITMDWLNRHKIKVKKLVMHPAATLAERERDDIAAFKAREFTAWKRSHRVIGPPPVMFIESDDRQAKRIAQLSGGMVVSPHAAKVY